MTKTLTWCFLTAVAFTLIGYFWAFSHHHNAKVNAYFDGREAAFTELEAEIEKGHIFFVNGYKYIPMPAQARVAVRRVSR